MKEYSRESSIIFLQIPVGTMANFSYIVADKETHESAIFDPAWEIPKLQETIERNSLYLKYIINTHSHHDHIEGNDALQKTTGAKIVMSFSSKERKDINIEKDDQTISLGTNLKLRFFLTPGHSPDSMCVIVDDYALITGDTLFIGECGRTDIPGGDSLKLYDSLEKIKRLDQTLLIYPGHDYGKKPFTTLKEQIEQNYTLKNRTPAEFIKFMSEP